MGDRAEDVEALTGDPWGDAEYRLAFISVVKALTVVYARFADLVEAALGEGEAAATA